MLSTGGLSTDQAPPFAVPMQFFLTAPWFAVAAGLVLAWQGPDMLATRWAPASLAAAHLLGLGFLGLVMCGALFQILPVLAGVPVPGAGWVSRVVLACWAPGAAGLAAGFIVGHDGLLIGSAGLLAAGILVFAAAVGMALRESKAVPETVLGMKLAVVALVVALFLGGILLAALVNRVGLFAFPAWVDMHLSWALLGWCGLLLVGVGLQLVPLFHVTPPYPTWLRRHVPAAILGSLLGISLGHWLDDVLVRVVSEAVGLAAMQVFAVLTVLRQTQRQRPLWDVTLSFWWLGLGCLTAAVLAWALHADQVVVGALVLAGPAVAIPMGMLYKIVPFLAWLHLQGRQLASGRLDVRLPHMRSFVPERRGQVQLAVLIGALALLVGALAGLDALVEPAGIAFAAAAVLFWVNLVGAWRRYRNALRLLAEPTGTAA
jgi:hypothetical protein